MGDNKIPDHLANISKEFALEYCVTWCMDKVVPDNKDMELAYQSWLAVYPDLQHTKEFFTNIFSNLDKHYTKLKDIATGFSPLDYINTTIGVITVNNNADIVRKSVGLKLEDINYTCFYKLEYENYNVVMDIITVIPVTKTFFLNGGVFLDKNKELHINLLADVSIADLFRIGIKPEHILYNAIAVKVLEQSDTEFTIGNKDINITIPKNSNVILDVTKEAGTSYVVIRSNIFTKEQLLELDKTETIYLDLYN